MDRRGFLLFLAGLPAALGLIAAAEPAAAPLPAALPEEAAIPFAVCPVLEEIYPFFWSSELVQGILAVPLLDVLVADSALVSPCPE